MKKVGTVLIVLQIIGTIGMIVQGNLQNKIYLWFSGNAGLYGLGNLIGFFLLGIIGIVLFLIGKVIEIRKNS